MISWILAGLAGAALLGSDSSSQPMVSSQDCKCQLCGRSASEKYERETREGICVRFYCSCGRTWKKWYTKKF